jgi:hypothetical protein
MDFAAENELRQHLGNDEKLLWAGKPRQGIAFRSSDLFLVPFSILWLGFAIFMEYQVQRQQLTLFALFLIPFLAIGLYLLAGRFFVDALQRQHTLYGITDNRIIIRSGIFNKEMKSLNMHTLSDLTFTEKKDGTGTIALGPDQYYHNTGFNGGNSRRVRRAPRLDLINEVQKVYSIIVAQQRRS